MMLVWILFLMFCNVHGAEKEILDNGRNILDQCMVRNMQKEMKRSVRFLFGKVLKENVLVLPESPRSVFNRFAVHLQSVPNNTPLLVTLKGDDIFAVDSEYFQAQVYAGMSLWHLLRQSNRVCSICDTRVHLGGPILEKEHQPLFPVISWSVPGLIEYVESNAIIKEDGVMHYDTRFKQNLVQALKIYYPHKGAIKCELELCNEKVFQDPIFTCVLGQDGTSKKDIL